MNHKTKKRKTLPKKRSAKIRNTTIGESNDAEYSDPDSLNDFEESDDVRHLVSSTSAHVRLYNHLQQPISDEDQDPRDSQDYDSDYVPGDP